MRFLIDECFPRALARALDDMGRDVVMVVDVCRSGTDVGVLRFATQSDRAVVTEDRDFGDIAVRDAEPAYGIVILHADRFPGGISVSCAMIAAELDRLGGSLAGALTVLAPKRTRQRALGTNTKS